ncbi:MAG: alpha-glucosidase [Sphaerochaetaceae bacterium]
MSRKWWEERVVYQVYPRSFADSNNDGIGDLRGIINKLDYFSSLGVGAIWLNPVYDSPNDDMGYDIRNYEKIMEDFGKMEDFDELVEKLHKRNIKLIMDLVVNHTSDEHRWFRMSSSNMKNEFSDFYIWRDKPNNWASFFVPSAWSYSKTRKQWYLHLFSEKQPDLNWENSDVRNEIYAMINRWLEKGVDGFRMDVINLIAKAKGLPDGKGEGYVFSPEYFAMQPKMHDYLKEMRQTCFVGRDCMCVGETPFTNKENAPSLVQDGKELDMIFQFDLMDMDSDGDKWHIKPFNVKTFRDILSSWQKTLKWNSLFLSNHDQPRSVSRFGNVSTEEFRIRSAKMLGTAVHLLKGTSFIYQGEELGMANVPFTKVDELRDLESLNFYNNAEDKDWAFKSILKKGRDNARTPMQWNKTKYAGFSEVEPWIGVNPDYKHFNAQDEEKQEFSVLNYYKKLIKLKTTNEIIIKGDFNLIMEDSDSLFAYDRVLGEKKVRIICNMTDKKVKIEDQSLKNIILDNVENPDNTFLLPYEARVLN